MTRPALPDAQAGSRALVVAVLWRALQVFVAALLTALGATDFIPALHTIQFWEDCAGAAITAGISVILGLAAEGAGAMRRGE